MSGVLHSVPLWAWLAIGLAVWVVTLAVALGLCRAARQGDQMGQRGLWLERSREGWADHLSDLPWDWRHERDEEAA